MLQQIISHTPIYVWLLLGFLVTRGLAASRDRALPLRQVAIIPAVMLVLALQDIGNRFGLTALPLAAWLGGFAVVTALVWRTTPAALVDRAAGTVLQKGSWVPLALMLAIVATKYAVAVACAMHPGLAQQTGFALATCTLYGVFNGLFAGRALRCLPLGRVVSVA